MATRELIDLFESMRGEVTRQIEDQLHAGAPPAAIAVFLVSAPDEETQTIVCMRRELYTRLECMIPRNSKEALAGIKCLLNPAPRDHLWLAAIWDNRITVEAMRMIPFDRNGAA